MLISTQTQYPIFINNYQKTNSVFKSVPVHKGFALDCFSKSGTQAAKNLIAINDIEYNSLISSLKYFFKRDRGVNKIIYNIRTPNEKNCVLSGGYFSPYKSAPHDLLGLIPYCGFSDISLDINHFLAYSQNGYLATLPEGKIPNGNKLLLDTDSSSVKKFIKCLNYSLVKLDEKYGVHKGVVYRGGIFDGNGKQYYSTSAEISPYVQINSQRKNDLQFHIIKTVSGHKIYKFQEDYYRPEEISMYDTEHEVLLSPSEYVEVENKVKYKHLIEDFAIKLSEQLITRGKEFTPAYVASKIRVWQEVKSSL